MKNKILFQILCLILSIITLTQTQSIFNTKINSFLDIYNSNFNSINNNNDTPKSIEINLPLRDTGTGSQKQVLPYLDKFCIGTPDQCFPVAVNFHESKLQIAESTLKNCSSIFNFHYLSTNSSSYISDDNTIYIKEKSFFGNGVSYKNAKDIIKISDLKLSQYLPFEDIIEINQCNPALADGLLGLGYKSDMINLLRNQSIIDKRIYSIAKSGGSLKLTLGDINSDLKKDPNKITFCKIQEFYDDYDLQSYWGCMSDIHINVNGYHEQHDAYENIPIIFTENTPKIKFDDEIIFMGKEKFNQWFLDHYLHNQTICTIENIDENTSMLSCNKDLEYKKLPNLQFVMDDFSYVFKPDDLFKKENDRYYLKIAFVNSLKYTHIKFPLQMLNSNSVSVVYDFEKLRTGFYGFKVHRYQGDTDDGNEAEKPSTGLPWWAIMLIALGAIAATLIIAFILYYFIKKRPEGEYAPMRS